MLFDVAKERYITSRVIPSAPSKLRLSDSAPDAGRGGFLESVFAAYTRFVRMLTTSFLRVPSRRVMRAWTLIGLGTHLALLYTAAAVSYFWPPALCVCLVTFATVMNAMLLILVSRRS